METQLQKMPAKETISEIAESLAEEIATRVHYKLKLLKHLPEIKAIEDDKIKALRGKEVHEFLAKLAK